MVNRRKSKRLKGVTEEEVKSWVDAETFRFDKAFEMNVARFNVLFSVVGFCENLIALRLTGESSSSSQVNLGSAF